MTEPHIAESAIRRLATGQSFARGRDYYDSGAVFGLRQRGDTVLAAVRGSEYDPYQVSVELGTGGVVGATCTCPYDWGGYCKHIVAVLLEYADQQGKIAQLPTAEALLADLDRDALHGLMLDLLEAQPELIDWVEGQLAIRRQQAVPSPSAQGGTPTEPPPVAIDTNAIRRQVRYQVRSSDHGYYATSGAVAGLVSIVEQAGRFLAHGDGRSALAILTVVAEETIPGWEDFDDSDGEFGDFFGDLGKALAEAILSADLSQAERKDLAGRLQKWHAELEDYAVEEGFAIAAGAIKYGWDYQPLQRAMQGHIADRGAWKGEAPDYAGDLTVIRLRILERQGRLEEYLNLAQAENQKTLYVTMLVKVGRVEEAVAYGLEYLGLAEEALALGQALEERRDLASARQIGERGLALEGNRTALARWLRGLAEAQGDNELALRAAQLAFERAITLEDYLAVEALAGVEWPAIKEQLLGQLVGRGYAGERIDIYLHEGMIEEAIRVVDEGTSYYATVEKVVDAAGPTHPDWAIKQCRGQAEPILDRGQSKYYHHAVRWLEKARQISLESGRQEEWRAYCQALIDKHARKYSVAPSLRKLL